MSLKIGRRIVLFVTFFIAAFAALILPGIFKENDHDARTTGFEDL